MLRNKLFSQISTISKYLTELQSIQFYNKASNLAINSYQIFFSFIRDNFNELDISTYQTLYLKINQIIIPNLRYIERSSTSNVPWSLISNLDKILKTEFGDQYFLLYRPQWRFNYSVLTTDLINFLKKFLEPFFPLKMAEISGLFSSYKIHIFSFPYLEKSNVLLNSIIGHEIGHFYHRKWLNTSDATTIIESQKVELRKHYKKLFPSDIFKPYEMTDEGIKILYGMYREIISDIYGYLIFGPSMIFSLFYISTLETDINLPARETNYYPITKYRIRILYKNLLLKDDKLKGYLNPRPGFNQYFIDYLKDIDKYLEDEDDLSLLQTKKKEIDLFETALPKIINYFESNINSFRFNPIYASKLFEKLDQNFPINEFENNPIDISSIIFSGWIYHYKIDAEKTDADYTFSNRTLMRLLMKSLFSTYVHQEYLDTPQK